MLVVAVAWLWIRLADRPFGAARGWGDREHVEGDDVPVVIELEPTGSVLPAAITLVERVGRLGEQRAMLSAGAAEDSASATRSRAFPVPLSVR